MGGPGKFLVVLVSRWHFDRHWHFWQSWRVTVSSGMAVLGICTRLLAVAGVSVPAWHLLYIQVVISNNLRVDDSDGESA